MRHSSNPLPPASFTSAAAKSTTTTILLLLLLLCSTFLPTATTTEAAAATVGATKPTDNIILPLEACIDFASGQYPDSPWTLSECLEVWEEYADTIPLSQQARLPFVDLWRDTAAELRDARTPCLAVSNPGADGVGSSTIRHLSAWIFAEEMGCDWATPDWGKKHVGGGNGTSVVYCHRASTIQEAGGPLMSKVKLREQQRCAMVDWLAYFQFGVPSVSLPAEGAARVIETSLRSVEAIERVTLAVKNSGLANQRWNHVIFSFDMSIASQHLGSLGGWDEARRQTVRKVLAEARSNFHVHPRPWYDDDSKCSYDSARLNFAIHVRLGDRRAFQDGNLEYFQLLELFMDTVSQEVVGKGLEPPHFHVFSETVAPCPSTDLGLFDEFPMWPVGLEQLRECLEAKTPDDCPEKQAGRFCSPQRPAIFNVLRRPITLHVGSDVQNALSCMIQADGLLMGCSTFGHVAGLLTKGISFFSMHCSGAKTPAQYKTIPPLAIAERGHLWVPVAGSWRDPILKSTEPLSAALDTLIRTREIS